MTGNILLTAAACLALPALAAPQQAVPMYKVMKAVTPPDEDAEIIFDAPAGELSFYSRNCTAFVNSYDGVERSDIMGSLVQQTYTADDGTLYLSNPLSDFILLSYLTASYGDDGSIVIEGPQFVYDEYDYLVDDYVKAYLLPMRLQEDEATGMATYVAADDMRYVLKKTDNGYEAADPDILLGLASYGELADIDGNPTGEVGYAWLGYGDRDISLSPREGSNGVTPPDGAAFDKWVYQDPYENAFINVALDGDDIYIQGIDRGVTDAWVKGRIADGKMTIPSGTYLGYNTAIQYYSYLWGATIEYSYEDDEEIMEGSPTGELVFDYDADARRLTLRDGYAICSMPRDFFLLTLYDEVSIYKQNRNADTPPAQPADLEVTPFDDYFETGIMGFNIPDRDTDGNLLDPERLYYRFYIDGGLFTFTPEEYPELGLDGDMVNVPYLLYDNYDIYRSGTYHTVYFHFELPEEGCAVQSVYLNEDGHELYSEITSSGSGVDEIAAEEVSRSYCNLLGQAVDSRYVGPVVCRIVYSDGSVKSYKTIRMAR